MYLLGHQYLSGVDSELVRMVDHEELVDFTVLYLVL